MNRNPIGVIDSGVGGLSILREIIKKLPNESFIYLADSANCPYGSKSSDEIYKLSKRLVQFLLKKKAKLVVIACNTITVACLDKLREDFPQIPIIGTVPVVKTASKNTKNGHIGILSTKQTAKSKYQKALIKKFAKDLKVLNIGTDKLTPIIENAEADKTRIDKILRKELKPFQKFNIDVLALGCSHFPFLKKEMQKILGKKVSILDSSGAIARQTKRILLMENSCLPAGRSLSEYNKPVKSFYTTGELKKFEKIKFEKINL
ncbi:MAG: glutamate racemase [Patescibacteria group bacterium]